MGTRGGDGDTVIAEERREATGTGLRGRAPEVAGAQRGGRGGGGGAQDGDPPPSFPKGFNPPKKNPGRQHTACYFISMNKPDHQPGGARGAARGGTQEVFDAGAGAG